ncbi:hypothetical protein [Haemophilus haemolyticus]|uniref:hypothetical protein n=1 Tax=Haemophilus haemolyticus TaxID=726 RepID=UPI00080314A9|nr:hypothetical protein [Haemophilus haemolyticus]OBX88480.1 hypothetical protein A9499_01160 [Haemophilus haemolyticus]
MREVIAILKKVFFSSIIITVLLSIIMYLRGYPAEILFVIEYIFPFFFFSMILAIYFGNYLKKEEKNIANKIKKKRGRHGS